MALTRKKLRGFKPLSKDIERYYERDRGFSKEHAEQVAKATAANIGRARYGKRRFQELSAAGRRKH